MAFSMSLISCFLSLVVVVSLGVIPVHGREISSSNFQQEVSNVEGLSPEDVDDSTGETKVKRQDVQAPAAAPAEAPVATPAAAAAPAPMEKPQGMGFWGRMALVAGNALLKTGKVVYNVADKVTLGATSALVEKAKDKAIEVAIEAYAGGMLEKEEGKREMEDNESPVLRTLRSQYGVDDKVEKREAGESGSGPEVKERPAE